MTTTAQTARQAAAPADTAQLVADVLDGLEIAERAYHHLAFGAPLVTELVARARRLARPGKRVLLIGGSALMVEALDQLGFDLDVWVPPGTYLTPRAKRRVTRTITPDALIDAEHDGAPYDLVIAPLILESLDRHDATRLLRSLRHMTAMDGSIVLATANQSQLSLRLAALGGKPFFPAREAATVSLGWPSLRTTRFYHRHELASMTRDAGLATHRCDHVTSEQPFMEMELLGVFGYGARKLGRLVTWTIPSTRDVLVLECSRRAGDSSPARTRADNPTITVFLSVRSGGIRLGDALGALLRQTYPADLTEIIVLDAGDEPGTADAVARAAGRAACPVRHVRVAALDPASLNAAMAAAASDISAHTDDTCSVPEDWIESAIAWMDAGTAVVSGPVFAADGSVGRHLEVAGTRPDPDEKGVPSTVMFPITNVFYRTRVAVAAGGFDPTLAHDAIPATGWDAEFAWRLQRLGWQARFREEVYQFRYFPPDAVQRGWVARQFRQASALPRLMASAPAYAAATLTSGIFASRGTMYFDAAVAGAGIAAARRQRRWLVLALPWLSTLSSRIDLWPLSAWPRSVKNVAGIAVRQSVWLAGFVVGSIKARRIVL